MDMEQFYRERCCSVVTNFPVQTAFRHRMAKIRHQDCFCERYILKRSLIKFRKLV